MKILKGFALVILGFLLFLSLFIFSLAFCLNSTVLSPRFITSEINRLDMSALIEQSFVQQPSEGFPPEFQSTLTSTIKKLEPVIEKQLDAVIYSVYDYLLGKKENPELAQTLRDSFFSKDFIVALLDEIPIASLAEKTISEQAAPGALPEELTTAMLNTVTKLEPEIKKQAGAAVDPVFGYLLGETQSVDLASVLRSTLLSKEFIVALLDEIDLAPLIEQSLGEQTAGGMEAELQKAMLATIVRLEPQIKQQTGAAVDPIFAYLVGESEDVDLASVLRSTLLSKEFIVAVVDELDMATLAKSLLSAQLTEQIPKEMSFLTDYIEKGLGKTLDKVEPMIKEQIKAAADPLADYLVGKRQGFSITISLSQVMTTLKEDLKAAIPAVIEEQFDAFYDEFSQMVPASIEINETVLGTGIQTQITNALAQAESELASAKQQIAAGITQAENELASTKQQIAAGITQAESALMLARTYVSYFQLGYWLLIVFMVLVVAGIVLIHRQVKPATRSLGTTFLTFGVIELASFFVGKYFAEAQFAQLPEVPAALETWLPQFFNNFMAPMMTFGIACAVLGLALIILSIVYKPREAAV